MCQAAVELVSSTDDSGSCVQHALKTISGGLGRPGKHGVAVTGKLWTEKLLEILP